MADRFYSAQSLGEPDRQGWLMKHSSTSEDNSKNSKKKRYFRLFSRGYLVYTANADTPDIKGKVRLLGCSVRNEEYEGEAVVCLKTPVRTYRLYNPDDQEDLEKWGEEISKIILTLRDVTSPLRTLQPLGSELQDSQDDTHTPAVLEKQVDTAWRGGGGQLNEEQRSAQETLVPFIDSPDADFYSEVQTVYKFPDRQTLAADAEGDGDDIRTEWALELGREEEVVLACWRGVRVRESRCAPEDVDDVGQGVSTQDLAQYESRDKWSVYVTATMLVIHRQGNAGTTLPWSRTTMEWTHGTCRLVLDDERGKKAYLIDVTRAQAQIVCDMVILARERPRGDTGRDLIVTDFPRECVSGMGALPFSLSYGKDVSNTGETAPLPSIAVCATGMRVSKEWPKELWDAHVPVQKEGYLRQMYDTSMGRDVWRKVYVVLGRGRLCVFESEESTTALSSVKLSYCTSSHSDHRTQGHSTFGIYLYREDCMFFQAPSDEVVSEWVDCISRAALQVEPVFADLTGDDAEIAEDVLATIKDATSQEQISATKLACSSFHINPGDKLLNYFPVKRHMGGKGLEYHLFLFQHQLCLMRKVGHSRSLKDEVREAAAVNTDKLVLKFRDIMNLLIPNKTVTLIGGKRLVIKYQKGDFSSDQELVLESDAFRDDMLRLIRDLWSMSLGNDPQSLTDESGGGPTCASLLEDASERGWVELLEGKSFKRYWLMLYGEYIFVYNQATDSRPTGLALVLENCLAMPADRLVQVSRMEGVGSTLVIVFASGESRFLRCHTDAQRDHWISYINQCVIFSTGEETPSEGQIRSIREALVDRVEAPNKREMDSRLEKARFFNLPPDDILLYRAEGVNCMKGDIEHTQYPTLYKAKNRTGTWNVYLTKYCVLLQRVRSAQPAAHVFYYEDFKVPPRVNSESWTCHIETTEGERITLQLGAKGDNHPFWLFFDDLYTTVHSQGDDVPPSLKVKENQKRHRYEIVGPTPIALIPPIFAGHLEKLDDR
ncbi:hypothetical protein KIPB_003353 [Kipferlia bialata]|uniref:PH domain-containing protein n=1 Tax=Kipferlia bialata TaxID=797122 RepID=A0A9K3CTK4_9EUKA|nr:hypothetical protein KIPB_003353 [Kipferlia bialata]|eukprot:g3353.t1